MDEFYSLLCQFFYQISLFFEVLGWKLKLVYKEVYERGYFSVRSLVKHEQESLIGRYSYGYSYSQWL